MRIAVLVNPRAFTMAAYRQKQSEVGRRTRERRPLKRKREGAYTHERYARPGQFDAESFRVTRIAPGILMTAGCLRGWKLKRDVG